MTTKKRSAKGQWWGIDLGGTKAEGVVLGEARVDDILFRERVPTNASLGYDHVLGQIKSLVDGMEKRVGYRHEWLGIGTPGTSDPVLGTMKGSNSECLNGMPLKADLEKMLGMNVAIANDANCFALAETKVGIVKEKFPGAKVVFGIIMGTGVGGGLVVDGNVIYGHHGIGGEWGHNFLDESGGPCYCGKSGCVEKVISGPALESFFAKESGKSLQLPEIYKLFKQGDPAARKTVQRLTQYFGRAISVIINIIDPDVIVVGGGVGNMEAIYTDGVAEARKYVFNNGVVNTPVVRPKLGDSAGVFGAAFLAANS